MVGFVEGASVRIAIVVDEALLDEHREAMLDGARGESGMLGEVCGGQSPSPQEDSEYALIPC